MGRRNNKLKAKASPPDRELLERALDGVRTELVEAGVPESALEHLTPNGIEGLLQDRLPEEARRTLDTRTFAEAKGEPPDPLSDVSGGAALDRREVVRDVLRIVSAAFDVLHGRPAEVVLPQESALFDEIHQALERYARACEDRQEVAHRALLIQRLLPIYERTNAAWKRGARDGRGDDTRLTSNMTEDQKKAVQRQRDELQALLESEFPNYEDRTGRLEELCVDGIYIRKHKGALNVAASGTTLLLGGKIDAALAAWRSISPLECSILSSIGRQFLPADANHVPTQAANAADFIRMLIAHLAVQDDLEIDWYDTLGRKGPFEEPDVAKQARQEKLKMLVVHGGSLTSLARTLVMGVRALGHGSTRT